MTPAIGRILKSIEERPLLRREMWEAWNRFRHHALGVAPSSSSDSSEAAAIAPSPAEIEVFVTDLYGPMRPHLERTYSDLETGAEDLDAAGEIARKKAQRSAPLPRTTGRYEDIIELPNGAKAMTLPCAIVGLRHSLLSASGVEAGMRERVRSFAAGGYHSLVVTGMPAGLCVVRCFFLVSSLWNDRLPFHTVSFFPVLFFTSCADVWRCACRAGGDSSRIRTIISNSSVLASVLVLLPSNRRLLLCSL